MRRTLRSSLAGDGNPCITIGVVTDHAPHRTPRISEWDSEFADRAFAEATRKLRGFFRLQLRNRADAEDVVQQACLNVLES